MERGPMDTVPASDEFLEIPASVRLAHARDAGRMDPLTGLADRRHLHARLERQLAGAAPESVAVLFIDLDRLKLINDTFGHDAGDRVLRVVGGRLRQFSSDVDLVVRLSGDEFAACVVDIPSVAVVEDVAERILEAIAQPITVRGHELSLTASIGVTTNTATSTVIDLLRHADEAMYDAKRAGRNQTRTFISGATTAAGLEISLRDLGRASGIETWFQSIVDESGTPVGVEALARWRQDGELLGPDAFVPLAERSGAMAAVTTAVLDQAVALAVTLDDEVTIHVNVSQTMLGDGRLAAAVEQACARAGVAPDRLCLEVTETALALDVGMAADRLRELRTLGCTIAVDDFGTGYGSLVLLRDAPIDCVKIDKSFIDSLETNASSQAIVRSIVTLAHGIEATVVAEGVDDEVKRSLSFGLGCDAIQGNLVDPPLDVETIRTRLTSTGRSSRPELR